MGEPDERADAARPVALGPEQEQSLLIMSCRLLRGASSRGRVAGAKVSVRLAQGVTHGPAQRQRLLRECQGPAKVSLFLRVLSEQIEGPDNVRVMRVGVADHEGGLAQPRGYGGGARLRAPWCGPPERVALACETQGSVTSP